MAFDPDAYLAQKPAAPPAAFDPDAYLQATAANVPGPRRTGTRADQIPGYGGPVPAATAPISTAPASFTERLLAPLETGVALATSAITAPIVEGAKILGTLTSGQSGTQAGIRAGEATGRRVQQFFQPALSPTAQAQTEAIGNALASTGIQGVPLNVLGDLSRAASTARQAAPLVTAPIAARQQRVQAQRVKESELNAPRIDAAKDAAELKLALDPSISNPSATTRLKTAAVGSAGLQGNLSKINLPQVAKVAREDLGLPETTRLDAKAFETSRSRPEISGAYDRVRDIPRVVADDAVLADIDSLRVVPTIGDTGQAAAVNNFLDTVKQQLQAGADGKTIVDSIRQRRRDAQAIYNQQSAGVNPPSPEAIARADVSMGVANALETAIENSITDPKLVADFRNARTALARTYDYERATNLATGVVDPQALARLAAEGKPLSGKLQKLANVAANFPEVMQGGVVREPTWREKLTRSSAGGTVGALVGSPFGLPGAIVGGGAGAAAGNVASALMARRMASPEYQRSVAMPRDYRPVPMGTTPGEVRYGPNALVPYNYAQEAFTPPNFVMMPERYGPEVNLASDLTRALPAPSAESTMANLQAIRQGQYRSDAIRAQAAEAQQAAAEAASRRPARGGENLVFDAAGNLVPETTARQVEIAGAPTALSSAVQKLSGQVIEQPSTSYKTMTIAPKTGAQPYTRIIKKEGETTFERGVSRAFDLTAEERIAWNKAKADLAEVAPGFKALTDKAIAAKMMDREWVAATAAKARQQAEALARRDALLTEQLANRDNLRLLARDIESKQRELTKIKEESVRIRDLADMLDENMRGPRPDTSRKQQGRKTLDAKRNALAPDNQNKLAP